MYTGKLIFSQVMDFLPMYEFQKCVNHYQGDYKVKHFSCLEQFYCMAFAQLTFRESLRDIETCLRSMKNKLYHMGIRSHISRNTISNANMKRNWRIYKETVYALDSTIIKLNYSLNGLNSIYALKNFMAYQKTLLKLKYGLL